jgi:hypothetical protein
MGKYFLLPAQSFNSANRVGRFRVTDRFSAWCLRRKSFSLLKTEPDFAPAILFHLKPHKNFGFIEKMTNFWKYIVIKIQMA